MRFLANCNVDRKPGNLRCVAMRPRPPAIRVARIVLDAREVTSRCALGRIIGKIGGVHNGIVRGHSFCVTVDDGCDLPDRRILSELAVQGMVLVSCALCILVCTTEASGRSYQLPRMLCSVEW